MKGRMRMLLASLCCLALTACAQQTGTVSSGTDSSAPASAVESTGETSGFTLPPEPDPATVFNPSYIRPRETVTYDQPGEVEAGADYTGEELVIEGDDNRYGGAQFVTKLFTEGASRSPSGAEFASYTARLEEKGCTVETLRELAKDFFGSEAYTAAGLNDRQAAFAVYRAMLNRDPSEAEIKGFQAAKAAETAAALADTGEFAALLPAIQAGPYFWGKNNTVGFTGDRVMTSAEVNQQLKEAEKEVVLPQGTLVLVTESIIIPRDKTLRTDGDPTHYTQMARLLRTNNAAYDMVVLNGKGKVQSIWVDGNRPAFEKDEELAYGRNVTLNGSDNTVQGCRVCDAIAPTNVYGADLGRHHYIADNLITCYASDHMDIWQDGITWAAASSIIEGNEIIDATDVGIVLFRYAATGSLVPQDTLIRDNIIINVGNSAFAGFDTDAWYEQDQVWRYDGSVFYDNQLWTSKRAHMHIGISLASVAWHAYRGDTMTGMSAYNNYTPEGCVLVCSCGIAVDAVEGAAVRGNQLKLYIGDWGSAIPALRPRIMSLNEKNSSGDMQPGWENKSMYNYELAFIVAKSQKEKADPLELKEAYIMEPFTPIPVEKFYG